ncbi:hypothetical protein [Nostoc sp. FACHB-280]|uniref:hypothetical protein n=1 Tax=Nostoc sp. FACHB-280 TaxID=2692839 RepID=UPI00168B53E4|nr:hypothetical protein [Nostoc sp. FACHB-280]MBD2498139.1 hypothetical protein [Nostoc sp. FACHB-280]
MMSKCDRPKSSDNDNALKVSKSAMMSVIAPSSAKVIKIMSIELNVKVNNPVLLKTLIEKSYSLLAEIDLVEQPKFKVLCCNQSMSDSYLDKLALDHQPFEVTIEIAEAKVFINIFSAGNSQFLDKEGGFWVYFEAGGEMLTQSVFMMTILAIAYASLTDEKIVDEASLLTKERYLLPNDYQKIIHISDKLNKKTFQDYSLQFCHERGILI